MSDETQVENGAPGVDPVKGPGPKKAQAAPRPPTATLGKHVYLAINLVKAELDKGGGITKDREAEAGGRYNFRGIDDMYNVLCRLTSEAGLVMIPRVVGEPRVEREERGNGRGFQTHVILVMEVDYVSQVDGSMHTGRYVGEAIDTSDKAANKAMSAAMKYACIMAFQIPTHGESDDTENYHHEVSQPAPQQARRAASAAADAFHGPAGPIAKATTFAQLHSLAQHANKLEGQARDAAFGAIDDAVLRLLEGVQDAKALQEARPLIKDLGQPEGLMRAYSAKYTALTRGPAQGAS